MPVKIYGIFSAYETNLCQEGLGRYMAAFLKGAAELENIRFIIVCTLKGKVSLLELCQSEGVPLDGFDIVTPTTSRLSRIIKNWFTKSTNEIEELVKIANQMLCVKAWYSPTAFWPAFNGIKAPTLMCVPDVCLLDFPVGFAAEPNMKEKFLAVCHAIRNSKHYVSYSEYVGAHTLVGYYGINPNNVHVVSHASNNLNTFVMGSCDENAINAELSYQYCHILFKQALAKSINKSYIINFANTSIKFLFFPSQIRPTKNVLTLLRAYCHLLKKRYITHKLILTGHPKHIQMIEDFIQENYLTKDVLFLHNLTVSELAACYKFADLAVNPSLFEGGFPHTFTEALSVNTPIIMARIPMTTEVVTDSSLQNMMLFDPYQWEDMAERIEWALNNKQTLLKKQMVLWTALSKRTWTQVVEEHVEILDQIAEEWFEQKEINYKNKNSCQNLRPYTQSYLEP